MLSFVWAEDENKTIGLNGELPWYLPADLKFFKKITMTGKIVMGRKTYQSFSNGPLAGREHIVLTRDKDFSVNSNQVKIAHSKNQAMELIRASDEPVHVIGGSSVFEQFVDEVTTLYCTVVHDQFIGDTHMPDIDYSKFELIYTKEGPVDNQNKHSHTYKIYKRIK